LSYKEPNIINEDENKQYIPGSEYIPNQPDFSPYVNPENVFIKHLTEVQYPEGIDEEFKKKWVHRLMFSGKEKSTSFVENPKTLVFNSLQRLNLGLMESLQCDNLIWTAVWENLDVMKMTQGQRGNLIHAITTKRQEFTDKTQHQPSTFRNKINTLLGMKNEQSEQNIQQGY